MRRKYVDPKKLRPMLELHRRFYDPSNYSYLERVIATDGFDPAYAIKIIDDEVFDGTHRTLVSQNLNIPKIPVLDYTGILTREQALAEGIKANQTHASYNPIDKAVHLKKLGESLCKKPRAKSIGRPTTLNLAQLSEVTKMDEKLISHYIRLLALPKPVQDLIGKGKLRSSTASVLLKLQKTPFENKIQEIVEKIVAEGWSYRKTLSVVNAVKKRGYYLEETKLCVVCKRAFPKDSVSYPCFCPECIVKLRSGKLGNQLNNQRTHAMQNYLKVNNFVSKLEKKGQAVPNWLLLRREELHQKWKETR